MEKIVRLKKNEDHRIVDGHLWAFSNEIEKIEGEPQAGDIAQLRNHSGKFLGSGFYNPQSLIAFRLLTRTEEELSFDFFRKRIETALLLRRKLFSNSETFRLVHGEGDYLPGLVIDKYSDLISVQTFSAGMDRRQT
jgi:23S rRNA (cytosine1962-C5)-methyltransferase